MQKRVMLFSFIFLGLLILLTSVFLFNTRKESFKEGQNLVYDEIYSKWQLTDRKPIAEVKDSGNADGFHNDTILRGFFDRFDSKTNTLYMKATVPFSNDQLYKFVTLKIDPNKSVYCTPSNMTDSRGVAISMRVVRFPVYNGKTLYTYFEQDLSLKDFIARADKKTWLFIQLEAPYFNNQDNLVTKLVAVSLCE